MKRKEGNLSELKTLEQQLKTTELALADMAKGYSVADLDSLKQDQQTRVKDFQNLYKLALKYQQLTGRSGFFSFLKAKEPVEYDAETLTGTLEKLRLETKREENIKRTLEEAIISEGLIKKMASDRVHLIDGKPCPFCGALKHAYAKYPPTVSNSKQALIDQKAKVRLLVEKVATTERKILIAGQQVEKKSAKQARLQLLRGEWLNLCNRLNAVSNELDITQLSLMNQLVKKETAELNELVNFITRYRSKQATIEKLNVSIVKSIARQESLRTSTAQWGVNSEGLNQEQQDLQATLSACQAQEQQLSLKVLEQLTLLGEKMPAKKQEDKLIDRLNARRQDYHGYLFRHKNLSEEIDVLVIKQAACVAEITHCNTQLELLGEQLQTQESLGLHLALIEKQKLIADKEQRLAQQTQATETLHQALLAKMQSSVFKNFQEISDKLELIARQPELERHYAELAQAIDAQSLALQVANGQFLDETKGLNTDLNATEVGEQIRRITRKIEINRMEAQQRERLLNEQKQNQQNYHDLITQLQQQEQTAQPYLADAELLATEHGMAFRRRVQERVADKLLAQTNALLEKISGRYYLRQIPGEQGLALEVEDTYQGNARRLPKTLSGGESFIVSLALALGLSELANNGRSVDSLFLDEGFGNLDAESLYTVITTLESLQTHGKTVGVISHVDAVQKRFKAQLHVVKKANGLAELRQ